jgi:hypothetical protein
MGQSDGNTHVCGRGEGMEYHKLNLFDLFHVRPVKDRIETNLGFYETEIAQLSVCQVARKHD